MKFQNKLKSTIARPVVAALAGLAISISTAGASDAEISAEDTRAAYAACVAALKAAFGGSGEPGAADYTEWTNFSTAPYPSSTHGGRYVNNYGNELAADYGKYQEAGAMPEGAIIAKDSISIDASGKASVGPLFLMERWKRGSAQTMATGNTR